MAGAVPYTPAMKEKTKFVESSNIAERFTSHKCVPAPAIFPFSKTVVAAFVIKSVSIEVWFATNTCFGITRQQSLRHKQTLLRDKQSLLRDKQGLLRDKQSLLRDKQSLLRDKQSLLRDKQSLLCDEQTLLRGKATFLSYEEALLRRRNSYKH